MSEEDYLLQCIDELMKAYQTAAQPYVDRLVAIRVHQAMSMRPMIVQLCDLDPKLAQQLGITP